MAAIYSAVTRITRLLLLLSSLFTLGFMLYAARPWEQEVATWLPFLGFAGWGLSPYAGLAHLAGRVDGSLQRSVLVLAVSLLLGGSAVVLQYQAFVMRPDPQAGLLYVFLPLYQWLATCLLFLLVLWHRRSAHAG